MDVCIMYVVNGNFRRDNNVKLFTVRMHEFIFTVFKFLFLGFSRGGEWWVKVKHWRNSLETTDSPYCASTTCLSWVSLDQL